MQIDGCFGYIGRLITVMVKEDNILNLKSIDTVLQSLKARKQDVANHFETVDRFF